MADWRILKATREQTELLLGDAPPPESLLPGADMVYIGPFARWVPIENGVRLEIKGPAGTWVAQQTFIEE